MGSVQVQHYLGPARDFFKGMDLLKDDLAGYRYASALLGIHSAVSYCDALRVGLGSKSLSSDDHRSAASELKRLLTDRKVDDLRGIDRLERLLGQKTKVAYSPDSSTETEVKQLVLHAARFAAWAEAAGKELKIEGWSDA